MSAQLLTRRRFLERASLFAGTGVLVGSGRATAQSIYDVTEYGAAGDGSTNDAAAIQKAIDACAENGGGRVLVPAGGRFLTGSIELKSHVDFHLEPGATLLGSVEQADYEAATLIRANGAENLTISGRGAIDMRGHNYMARELPYIYRPKDWRPRMMILEDCRNVRLENLTLRNSALWTVHLAGCRDVAVRDLSILNDRKIPNCDGIAVDSSKNVRISGCHITAGDDCIVLKTLEQYAEYGDCENVTVQGCTLESTSAAIKIGTETINDIRNLTVDGCVIRDSHRGLGILLRDGGTVENLLYANCTIETRFFHDIWWGAAEPISVTALPREEGHEVGTVRNVRFSNLLCRGENGVYVRGSEESRPRNIRFEDVRVEMRRTTDVRGGEYDLSPWDVKQVYEYPSAGFYCEQAAGVHLEDCAVDWSANPPAFYRHALEVRDTAELDVEDFTGQSAHPSRFAARKIG